MLTISYQLSPDDVSTENFLSGEILPALTLDGESFESLASEASLSSLATPAVPVAIPIKKKSDKAIYEERERDLYIEEDLVKYKERDDREREIGLERNQSNVFLGPFNESTQLRHQRHHRERVGKPVISDCQGCIHQQACKGHVPIDEDPLSFWGSATDGDAVGGSDGGSTSTCSEPTPRCAIRAYSSSETAGEKEERRRRRSRRRAATKANPSS